MMRIGIGGSEIRNGLKIGCWAERDVFWYTQMNAGRRRNPTIDMTTRSEISIQITLIVFLFNMFR